MFGCCVAGRLVQTDLQQIDDTHACFWLEAASSMNHICLSPRYWYVILDFFLLVPILICHRESIPRWLWRDRAFLLAQQRFPAIGNVSIFIFLLQANLIVPQAIQRKTFRNISPQRHRLLLWYLDHKRLLHLLITRCTTKRRHHDPWPINRTSLRNPITDADSPFSSH